MATLTCTIYNAAPKAVQIGVQSVSGQFSQATALSVGDIIFLAKIPTAAKYVSIEVDHTSNGGALGVDYGYANGSGNSGAASYSCFITAGAMGTALRKTVLGVPADTSVSVSDPLGYAILSAKVVSGSMSISNFINFTFCYRTDGPGG